MAATLCRGDREPDVPACVPEIQLEVIVVIKKTVIDNAKLDQIVADAQRNSAQRDAGYRERALKLYPWVCGRCAREFTRSNLRELTVHHKNHNHDYNPEDGSNWELLCLYCHDNEHARYADNDGRKASAESKQNVATGNPFADLKALMGKKPE